MFVVDLKLFKVFVVFIVSAGEAYGAAHTFAMSVADQALRGARFENEPVLVLEAERIYYTGVSPPVEISHFITSSPKFYKHHPSRGEMPVCHVLSSTPG